MSVRTAYVGTQSVGDVLTSANFSKLPGGWIGYAEATSSQTGITTITDLTSLSVVVTVGTNRRIRIKGHSRLTRTVGDGQTLLDIRENTSDLGYILTRVGDVDGPYDVERILTPTSGAHTYKLSLSRFSGTGTVATAVDATNPAWILVEDIGPAS